MTTARQLVDSTIDDVLMTGEKPLRARLNADIDDTVTDIVLKDVQAAVGPDSVLQIAFEQAGAWSYAESSSTATVQRGDHGSTAAAHSEDDIVEFDPEFPRSKVLSAIQQEIRSLSDDPGIWKPLTVSIPTPSTTDIVFDLGANDVRRVLDVRQLVRGDWIPLRRWRIVRGLSGETGFTGDVGLELIDARTIGEIRIIVATPLGAIDATTADVETTTGVSANLLALGAAVHLNAGRPIKRSLITAQGSSRRANEVAPFQTVNSGREIKALYKKARGETITRLNQMYPHRRNVK